MIQTMFFCFSDTASCRCRVLRKQSRLYICILTGGDSPRLQLLPPPWGRSSLLGGRSSSRLSSRSNLSSRLSSLRGPNLSLSAKRDSRGSRGSRVSRSSRRSLKILNTTQSDESI